MKDIYTLVTGSSSGIGREIAIQMSKAGHVILHGRDRSRLLDVKEQCSRTNKQIIWTKDLNLVEDIEQDLSNFILENNIEVNNFVHCAGHMKMAPLKMSTVDLLSKTLNTNVIAPSSITRVLTQKKVNNASLCAVVFISSNISNMGAKGMSAYGASKGALDSLMRCLAVELAPKVRVNSVLPGAVVTEMTQAIFDNPEVRDRMAATYPLGIGETKDIYEIVNFLLSKKAKWITGQQFTVDGGRTVNISG